MALNLASFFSQVDAHVEVYFTIDGYKYKASHFKIGFYQPIDFKGQPQHEVKGGQFSVTLSQIPHDDVFLWAKTANLRKNATIIFWSEMIGTPLEIKFIDASCIRLTQNIDAITGVSTSLVITPNTVMIDEIIHENYWK